MNRLLFILGLLLCVSAHAQTPTLVWNKACPDSGTSSPAAGMFYTCQFPEATISGDTLVVGFGYDNTGSPQSFTVSDGGDTFTAAVTSANSAHGNQEIIYTASNIAAGNTQLKIVWNSGNTNGFWVVRVAEFYNVSNSSPVDKTGCANPSSTSITAGALGTMVSGDLIYQFAYPDTTTGLPQTSFTAGSQSNITWALLDSMLLDSSAAQYGVYTTTTGFTPTFTQGTSIQSISCAVALKAASAGSAPSSNLRMIHVQDDNERSSTTNPRTLQFESTGNFAAVSYVAGAVTINSITSSPSCAAGWTKTGNDVSNGGGGHSIIFYCPNSSFGGKVTLTITKSAATSNNGTYMLYDATGPGTWALDKDSGALSGSQGSIVASMTTCTACFTPTNQNELILTNLGQTDCTATGSSAPSGSLFDAATFLNNGKDGPQPVDENNGWLHFYNGASVSAITVTWTESCGSNPENAWISRMAAFKSPSGGAACTPTLTLMGVGRCG